MNNTIDLQIQTIRSDGKLTPKECVSMAKYAGIEVIAITDHDTVAGVEEATIAAEELGIRNIPGIEMSAEEMEMHILAFGIDCENERLLRELDTSRQGRLEGARQMMENLKKNEGFVVEWEDVLNDTPGSDTITRPHIVRAIMNRPENKEKLQGITKHDFFSRYFSNDGPNYVARAHMSAKDAIGLIHSAGGVAVWSHPALSFKNDPEGMEKFLHQLIEWDIDGLEVFNPSHTEDDTEFINSLAIKYHLLRTAGSDFHQQGENTQKRASGELRSADKIGDYETFGFSTDDIIEKLDAAMSERKSLAAKLR